MKDYIKLNGDLLFAFVCKDRKKDYGGIYFGIYPDSIPILRNMIFELKREGIGYSRKIGLSAYSSELPERILTNGHFYALKELRIKLNSQTQISIDDFFGAVDLSIPDASEFLRMLGEVENGSEDISLAGETQNWDDRLHFWTLGR